MYKRPSELLIADILESIEKIEGYILNISFEDFKKDSKTVDAVVRNLEVIGEASNRLPEDFKERHSRIEWTKIIGLRNRIVHVYFGVYVVIIWNIIQKELIKFKKEIKSIRL